MDNLLPVRGTTCHSPREDRLATFCARINMHLHCGYSEVAARKFPPCCGPAQGIRHRKQRQTKAWLLPWRISIARQDRYINDAIATTTLEALVNHGLYELYPPFADETKRSLLYRRVLQLRQSFADTPEVPTSDEVHLAQTISVGCFLRVGILKSPSKGASPNVMRCTEVQCGQSHWIFWSASFSHHNIRQKWGRGVFGIRNEELTRISSLLLGLMDLLTLSTRLDELFVR